MSDTMTLSPPVSYTCIGAVMTNFDHSIEEWADERLRAGDVYGDYPGRDFFGKVWFDGESFQCQVWQYGSPVETIAASSLEDLMDSVSEVYGWD